MRDAHSFFLAGHTLSLVSIGGADCMATGAPPLHLPLHPETRSIGRSQRGANPVDGGLGVTDQRLTRKLAHVSLKPDAAFLEPGVPVATLVALKADLLRIESHQLPAPDASQSQSLLLPENAAVPLHGASSSLRVGPAVIPSCYPACIAHDPRPRSRLHLAPLLPRAA
jgi:hypothetical protein